MKQFAVLTADIIDSKRASRIDLQLKPQLSRINYPFLVTPFSMYRGDEIQAVCSDTTQLPRLIRELRYFCRPFRIRLGIGIGGVEGSEFTLNSWEMNGEAFFMARNALDYLSKEKFAGTRFKTNEPLLDLALNTVYRLVDAIVENWTDAQWEAIHSYQQFGTYIRTAEALGIARQNVQKRCYAAKWNEIRQAEENVSKLLAFDLIRDT
ncbi:SatD family protein [Hydrogenispora ethanolica]|uniref:SatD family protein n=1 Tax=Hydrogenispora ethanolica TaxID=1082276 RepID=A0A4R1REE2_HYDET|nr:SatD family protein [Hydrogenispora ethanolica]TCL64199.1 SatD family protein [Hydrogenispora ethanolica]